MGIFNGGIASIFILILAIVAVFTCIICMIAITSHRVKSRAAGHEFAPFYIENEMLIINNARAQQYALSELSHIVLGFSKAVGHYRSRGMAGYFQVVKTNEKTSIKFLFDASVYTHNYSFLSTRNDIEKSMIVIEKELSEAGILCVRK